MNQQIRPATQTEVPQLFAIMQKIVEAERPFDSTLAEGDLTFYDLTRLIASLSSQVLVIVIDNEIIGSGYAEIRAAKAYQKHSQYAHLGFMYVAPEHRGKGLNGMLIAELEQWAKANGVYEIRLEVYDKNTSALKAYNKLGYVGNILEMRKDIS